MRAQALARARTNATAARRGTTVAILVRTTMNVSLTVRLFDRIPPPEYRISLALTRTRAGATTAIVAQDAKIGLHRLNIPLDAEVGDVLKLAIDLDFIPVERGTKRMLELRQTLRVTRVGSSLNLQPIESNGPHGSPTPATR